MVESRLFLLHVHILVIYVNIPYFVAKYFAKEELWSLGSLAYAYA